MNGSAVSRFAFAPERFNDLIGFIKRAEEPPFANLSRAFGNMLFNQNSLTRKIIINRYQFGNRHTSPADDNLFTGLDSQKQPRQFGLDPINSYLNYASIC